MSKLIAAEFFSMNLPRSDFSTSSDSLFFPPEVRYHDRPWLLRYIRSCPQLPYLGNRNLGSYWNVMQNFLQSELHTLLLYLRTNISSKKKYNQRLVNETTQTLLWWSHQHIKRPELEWIECYSNDLYVMCEKKSVRRISEEWVWPYSSSSFTAGMYRGRKAGGDEKLLQT